MIEWAPAELCLPDAPLWQVGIYRKVSCSKAWNEDFCKTSDTYEEFVSICSKEIKNYNAAHVDMIEEWLTLAKKGAR